LKRAGTTLSVSAYALDKSGGNHFKKLTLSGGRDVVGVVVGTCAPSTCNPATDVQCECYADSQCGGGKYCSLDDSGVSAIGGVAGHCCTVGQVWTSTRRGGGYCDEPSNPLVQCSCSESIYPSLQSTSVANDYLEERRSGNFPVELSIFDKIRLFFYRPVSNEKKVYTNSNCIRENNGRREACLEMYIYGQTRKYWQEYTIYP